MIIPKKANGTEMLAALRGHASWGALLNAWRVSGVYDTKNACIAKIYAGAGGKKSRQNWWQRVPAFVLSDFQLWAKAQDALLTLGEDMVWVFSGKLRSTERILEAEFQRLKWESKPLTLVYDPRTMRHMYWVRERGMGNAGMSEVLFCCWKGRVPRCFPSNCMHVDAGAPVYYDVMQRAQVASESELLLGSPADRDLLLALLGADSAGGDEEADAEEDAAEEPDGKSPASKRKYAKRHSGRALCRVSSSDQVPLFPLDNSPRLMKEIAHESGNEPRGF
jgi:hypothetical protein